MSKCLVVFNKRLPIPGWNRDFNSVYGTFYIYEGYCEVGNQEGVVIKFPHDLVDYLVQGLEGTDFEPLATNDDTLVL